ncbi:MAG TPA: hypothetical protein VFD90_07560 [Gaiellales bacterium]|nr:hypothetical protein [Gaiellales bacterium]
MRLLRDECTQIVWLHVQEDGGAEHVVGVPALEARDAFLCPSLYIGFERALEAAGSSALDRG